MAKRKQTNAAGKLARLDLFVAHFVGAAKWNAAEAARLCGYKGTAKVLSVTANKLMNHPHVKEKLGEFRRRADVEAEEIIDTLALHMRTTIEDFLDVTPAETADLRDEVSVDLGKAYLLKRLGAVKKLKQRSITIDEKTERIIEIELYDAQSAAMNLAKLKGMVIKRHEVKVEYTPGNLDDDDAINKYLAAGVPLEKWLPGIRRRFEARQRKQIESKVIETKEPK